MRIAAMAAGAVGGYFGARMAAAGHDVFFIARGAHRDAIAKNGLKIESVHGDLHLPKPNVTDDPATVGPVDIVLFAVKLWDTEKAAELARPLVGPDSRLITLQNGVDSVERIAPILGAEQTIGGVAYIATIIAAPGVIKHTSQFAKMRFGRADKKPDAQAAGLRRCRQGRQDRHRHLRRYRARALGEIRLPHRHGRLHRGPAFADRADRGRPGAARILPPADGRGFRHRQSQGRRARSGLYRGAHGLRARARSSPA